VEELLEPESESDLFTAHHNTPAIKSTPIIKLPKAAGLFIFGGVGFIGATVGTAGIPVVEGGGADVRAFPQE